MWARKCFGNELQSFECVLQQWDLIFGYKSNLCWGHFWRKLQFILGDVTAFCLLSQLPSSLNKTFSCFVYSGSKLTMYTSMWHQTISSELYIRSSAFFQCQCCVLCATNGHIHIPIIRQWEKHEVFCGKRNFSDRENDVLILKWFLMK
jgi:hypothetical protein